jgi:hypothetical protein
MLQFGIISTASVKIQWENKRGFIFVIDFYFYFYLYTLCIHYYYPLSQSSQPKIKILK